MSEDLEKVIIAAVAKNGVIGKDGDIPWHYPEDMEHFKQKAMGYPVVMGRGTYESLPDGYRPLPGRTNVVLTRSGFEAEEGVKTANSLDEAWRIAREESRKTFIIGGSTIYEQTIDEADRMILTRIHREYDGDTFFPDWDTGNWEEVERDDRGEMSFVEYLRA